jgi:hypothetical protein
MLLAVLAPLACPQEDVLKIDPRLLAEATEVWALLASDENPVWPGWDAGDTPLYFYFPGVQEVLIGHPAPPAGFTRYSGALAFPGREIWLHDGATLVTFDGQNTTREIGGVRVLVVADTLSSQRQELEYLIRDERPADERMKDLDYARLAADPYAQMSTIAHEAFHAFQARWIGTRADVELFLLHYPTLSVENNVGMAFEGLALKDALLATDLAETESAVLRWLALRKHRRAAIPAEAIQYEDGTELNEGLAKYVEWRLSQTLEGRTPGPGMAWVSGFGGYADLAFVRTRLIEDMCSALSGEKLVNNDPYGTAPIRFRLYYSGMAIAALLDRLMPEWKERIVHPGTTLAGLAEEALAPDEELLDGLIQEALADPRRADVVAKKTRLAEDGREAARKKLAALLAAEKGLLCVDYSALGAPPESWSFTPFGITVVDEQHTIYDQIPVSAQFSDASRVSEIVAAPFLHDAEKKQLWCPLADPVTASELGRLLGTGSIPEEPVADLDLSLPGVEVHATRARVRSAPGRVTVELLPAR